MTAGSASPITRPSGALRKSWLFAGSERETARASAIATLIMTAKLDDVDLLAQLSQLDLRICDFRCVAEAKAEQ
jgi:hypothetical protein